MNTVIEEKIEELKKMGIVIIHRPGSKLIELWINNIFVAQGDDMYINSYLEQEAIHENTLPEDEYNF